MFCSFKVIRGGHSQWSGGHTGTLNFLEMFVLICKKKNKNKKKQKKPLLFTRLRHASWCTLDLGQEVMQTHPGALFSEEISEVKSESKTSTIENVSRHSYQILIMFITRLISTQPAGT